MNGASSSSSGAGPSGVPNGVHVPGGNGNGKRPMPPPPPVDGKRPAPLPTTNGGAQSNVCPFANGRDAPHTWTSLCRCRKHSKTVSMHRLGWAPTLAGQAPTTEQWERLVAQSAAQKKQIDSQHERSKRLVSSVRCVLNGVSASGKSSTGASIETALRAMRVQFDRGQADVERCRSSAPRKELESLDGKMRAIRGALKKALLASHPDKVSHKTTVQVCDRVVSLLTLRLTNAVQTPRPPPPSFSNGAARHTTKPKPCPFSSSRCAVHTWAAPCCCGRHANIIVVHREGWTPPMVGKTATVERWGQLVAQSAVQQQQLAKQYQSEQSLVTTARHVLDGVYAIDESTVFTCIEKGLAKMHSEINISNRVVRRYENGDVARKVELVTEQYKALRSSTEKCKRQVQTIRIANAPVATTADTVTKLLTPLLEDAVYPMRPPKL